MVLAKYFPKCFYTVGHWLELVFLNGPFSVLNHKLIRSWSYIDPTSLLMLTAHIVSGAHKNLSLKMCQNPDKLEVVFPPPFLVLPLFVRFFNVLQ